MNTYFGVNFSEFNQHGLTQSLGLCPLNSEVLIVGMCNVPHRLMYLNTRYPAGGAVLGTVDASGHGTQLANIGAFMPLRTG